MKVSIIIPAYNSHKTIARCIESFLSQDYYSFEIIVVDSSPNDLGSQELENVKDKIQYFKLNKRMFPFEARSYGLNYASGDLIVHTDPDIYAPSSWVNEMVCSYQKHGGIICGGLRNFGNNWLNWGIHITKFDLWLPSEKEKSIPICPSAVMLLSKRLFDELGGFGDSEFMGDTWLSLNAIERRKQITFNPKAWVYHHHISTFSQFLKERYNRAYMFRNLPKCGTYNSLKGLLNLCPRLIKLMLRSFWMCFNARLLATYFLTLPLIFAGHSAWIAGELKFFLKQ